MDHATNQPQTENCRHKDSPAFPPPLETQGIRPSETELWHSKENDNCSFQSVLVWISLPWCLYLHLTTNDAHLGLPCTHLSGVRLSQHLQWWKTTSVGSEAKSASDSVTSMDRFPCNRSERCNCNSWQMRRILVWPWSSQQYLVPQADAACKRQDRKCDV